MAIEENDFREDECQIENEEDIGNLDQNQFAAAVVSGNDWTTETYSLTQIFRGEMLGIRAVKADLLNL